MQLDEAGDQGKAQAGAPLAGVRRPAALEGAQHPLLVGLGDADAGVGDGDGDVVAVAPRGEPDGAARGREGDGVAQQVEQHLLDALLVGHHPTDVGRAVELHLQGLAPGPLAGQVEDTDQHGVQVHGVQLEGHGAGLDGGQVQDIADHRGQVLRRLDDAAAVFHLPLVERAEVFLGEDLGEADDGVERRAHFVGHVGDELGFEAVRLLHGLGPLAQGELHPDAVGDVQIAQQHRAVGERQVGVVEHRPVAAQQPAGAGLAAHQALDHPFLMGRPVVFADDEGAHLLHEVAQVRLPAQILFAQLPQLGQGGVAQLQPPVAAEDGDALVQVVQRRPLDGDQRVVGTFQIQPVGDVLVGEDQAAQGVGADDAAQGGSVGEVQKRIHGLGEGAELGDLFLLEGPEVGVFGEPPQLPQPFQHLGQTRFGVQPAGVDAPQFGIGRVEEAEPGVGPEDGDGRGQVLQHLVLGGGVAPGRLFRVPARRAVDGESGGSRPAFHGGLGDLEEPLRPAHAQPVALGHGLSLRPRAHGQVAQRLLDGPAGAGAVGERQVQVGAAQPHGHGQRVEKGAQRAAGFGGPDGGGTGGLRRVRGPGYVAHPQQVGERPAVDGAGAHAHRLHHAPGRRQQQIECGAIAAQRLHRLLQRRRRLALEPGAHVGEPRLCPGGQAEEHGQTARTAFSAVDVVPQEKAVGRRRQDLAVALGGVGEAPAFVVRPGQPAVLAHHEGRRHRRHSESAERESENGSHYQAGPGPGAARLSETLRFSTGESYA